MRTPSKNKKAAPAGTGTTHTAHAADCSKNSDFVTCLATFGPALTKTYKADGTVEPYGDAASFAVKRIEVANLKALSALLKKLETKPQHCIIRGEYVGDDLAEKGKAEGSVARSNVNFNDCPHHWLLIDIDKYEPDFGDPVHEPIEVIKDYLAEQLPACFQDVSFHWQLSSSAGTPGKEHILKAHVWFWSETPYTSAQMYEWAKQVGPRVDKAVFRRVQVHYTASPIFEEGGMADPVPVRSGFYQGARDTLPLKLDPHLLEAARTTGTGSGGSDMKLVDPSEKEGLVGAFHRTYDAHTVLMEHLDGMFEPGQNDRRWTWLDGGGTPEGVWVHDDGMHVGATHNTWPLDGIANLWDLVRVFKFGHLDTSEDEFEQHDIDERPIQAKPSNIAMLSWAGALPELKEAMAEETEQEARNRQAVLERFRAEIRSATDEYVLRERICPEISREPILNASQRDALAVEVNNKLGQVTGAKPGLGAVKSMLRPERSKAVEGGKPVWLEDWFYVTDVDKFYRYNTEEWLTVQGFNKKHNRFVPLSDDGKRVSADQYATEYHQTETVVRGIYLPWAGQVFDVSNTRCVNTYRPSSVPSVASKMDADGRRAVKLVKQHLLALCNQRTWLVEVLLDWIAHNVQHPGLKIKFSPVIQGIEGDGKSLIGVLMAQIMGEPNVRVIAPEVVSKGDFNGWAEGGCVGVLEELRLQGNNRFDILNSVKPCVTNEQISVHRKNRDPYNAPNTMNYVAFTNHKDALPLDDTDRRWMVIFAPWDSIGQFEKIVGTAPDEYFSVLHAAIFEHSAQIRRFFLDRDLSVFNRHGRAPDTEEKKVMVSLGVPDDLATARELIQAGGVGFCHRVASSRMLSRAIEDTGLPPPKSTAMNRLMLKLGFQRYPESIKWEGETHRVWVKEPVTSNELVRRLLNATLEDEVSKDFED